MTSTSPVAEGRNGKTGGVSLFMHCLLVFGHVTCRLFSRGDDSYDQLHCLPFTHDAKGQIRQ